jgi:hypothetical protein
MVKSSHSFSGKLLAPILTPLAALLAKKITATTYSKATGSKPPTKKSPGSFKDNVTWAIALTTMLALTQMLVQKFLENDKD